MAFWDLNTLQLEEFRPGLSSKAEIGDDLIMVYMEIDAGKEDTGHRHKHDQCGVILAGRIEMFIDQERRELAANETYFIPAGVQHGWKTYDRRVKLLDIAMKQPQECKKTG